MMSVIMSAKPLSAGTIALLNDQIGGNRQRTLLANRDELTSEIALSDFECIPYWFRGGMEVIAIGRHGFDGQNRAIVAKKHNIERRWGIVHPEAWNGRCREYK